MNTFGIKAFPLPASAATLLFAAVLSASVAHADTRFAVIGDYGNTTAATNVANRLKSFSPGFVTTTGDNVYVAPSTVTDLDNAIGIKYGSFIKNNASAVQTAAVNNFYPSIGNHDIDAGPTATGSDPNFAINFLNYFNLTPANDPAIQPGGNEKYYDVIRGDVHLFILSADTRDTTSGQAIGSAQRNWLMGTSGNNGVLAASTSPWNIVVFHQPAYSTEATSGDHFSNPYLQWGFTGAQVIYNGHAHDYERTSANGQQYVVEGTGGQSLSSFSAPAYTGISPAPRTEFRENSNNGFTLVDADANFYTSKHIQQNGNMTDHFTLTAPGVAAPTLRTFQQNVAGYTGAHNRELREDGAATTANAASLKIDFDDNGASGNQRTQALLRFDSIIGNAPGQIPLGATITSATLRINVSDAGSGLALYRMKSDWSDATATWTSLGNGIDTNDLEAASVFDATIGQANATSVAATTHVGTGNFNIDVLSSLRAWAKGDPNYGWAVMSLSTGTDGIIFSGVNGSSAPLLSVEYIVPAAAVPEPAALTLLALGCLPLLARRRSTRN